MFGTTWHVVELYSGDEPVSLAGASSPSLAFTFEPAQIRWGDGCNIWGGDLTIDDAGNLGVGETTSPTSTAIGCPEGDVLQPWDVIGAVMGADRIAVDLTGDRLDLSGGDKDRIILERI